MKRRQFASGVLGSSSLALLGHAQAQAPAPSRSKPVEGTHYVRLGQPVATTPAGKIEVIEFFWYGCPHCHAFEPALESWVRRLPADVAFRRVPVAFRQEPFVAHQRIFYALESLGALTPMHGKVFYAIHRDRLALDRPAEIAAFMAKNGVDTARFTAAYDSFSVQTKVAQATRLAADYKIDGVPALGVHGRFYTSGSLAGSNEAALAVVDFLVDRVRKTG